MLGMKPFGLQQVIVKAARTLIQSNSLNQFRFDRSVVIGVDATEIFQCKIQHCEKCLIPYLYIETIGQCERYSKKKLQKKLNHFAGLII